MNLGNPELSSSILLGQTLEIWLLSIKDLVSTDEANLLSWLKQNVLYVLWSRVYRRGIISCRSRRMKQWLCNTVLKKEFTSFEFTNEEKSCLLNLTCRHKLILYRFWLVKVITNTSYLWASQHYVHRTWDQDTDWRKVHMRTVFSSGINVAVIFLQIKLCIC